MQKGNKKEKVRNITVQDVTKEIFELCKETEPCQHTTAGKVISVSQLKTLCPSCAPYFKNFSRLIPASETVKLSEEEAQAMGVKIFGNPNLGIRMYTEKGCEQIGMRLPESAQKHYFLIVKCVFHKEEVKEALYPGKTAEPEKKETPSSTKSTVNEDALTQMGKIMLYQMEIMKEQAAALSRIADSMSAIQKMMAENQKRKDVLTGKQVVHLPEKTEKIEEKNLGMSLKLKRGEKDPVYRVNPRSVQAFREDVLEGIPNALHNSVLHHAYTRMRNVYGVPVDTYRNEYFADTGKPSKNSLEIVHWLEFRNPAIRGLLKSCVQNAMEASCDV